MYIRFDVPTFYAMSAAAVLGLYSHSTLPFPDYYAIRPLYNKYSVRQ